MTKDWKSFPSRELDFKKYSQLFVPGFEPRTLFAQGSQDSLGVLASLPGRGLAIVGTRHPSPRSLSNLRRWVHALRDSNLVIISGLARGIDAMAHRAAIEAGLPTVAILGSGLDSDYPKENHDLRYDILASGGLVLTEHESREPPHSRHFLQRNRLIAAWARAVWIVEAPYRSGALNTAKWARDLDRDCYATPCFPGDPAFVGNQLLIDEYLATPVWDTSSLSQTWLELSSKKSRKQLEMTLGVASLAKNSPADDLAKLTHEVTIRTIRQGGAQVQELLDWSIAQTWTPQRFFTALQSGLGGGHFVDENGLLLKNPI